MIDKSWMLNPQAIRQAKTCIRIIKERTEKKLTLSQADFFQQLEMYSENFRSAEFTAAHAKLMSMASTSNITGEIIPPRGITKAAFMPAQNLDSVETIIVAGKHYPKWQEGKEFHGLYRGQPHYR